MTIKFAPEDELVQALATINGLKGHSLLLLLPLAFKPSPEKLQHLRDKFPGLKVTLVVLEWFNAVSPASISGEGDGFDWQDVTVLVTGSALPTRQQAPKLQYVQLLSAGANHVLQNPLFDDPNIALCTANGVHGPQISEWIISTFLSFEHHLPKFLDLQKQGKWDRAGGGPVEDAVGRRVGVLGYGSIGRQVARLAKAMGMDVHAYTLHPRETPESRHDDTYAPPGTGDPEGIFPSKWFSGGSKEDMHRFLSSGLDLLVVSAPLTDKTTHLLGAEEFKVLAEARHGATFISNIARGKVIDTDALVSALEEGLVRGAALDVTDPEPLPEGHPLWKAKNTIITPHISGSSTAYGPRALEILELNLGRLSEGRPPINRVNRKDGY